MAVSVGLNCKFYRNSGGSFSSPTWNEVTPVKDVSVTMDLALADASSRSAMFRQYIPTLSDLEVTVNKLFDGGADDVALYGNYLNRTLEVYAVADNTITVTGTTYIKFEGYVTNFTETQALEDVSVVDYTFKPGYSTNVPTVVVV